MWNKLIWVIVSSVIGVIITACWNVFNSDSKELTICEERQIDIFDTFDDNFILYTKDSIKLENYHIVEYSITNTGNTTIVGTGIHSDLLVEDNNLKIASDSVVVKICNKDESLKLINNYIRFKQIRPDEKITLVCVSRLNEDNQLIRINDRDIKDTNIVYTKRSSKLTAFEKTTSTNRWISVVGFLFSLICLFAIIIISSLDMIKELTIKNIIYLIVWLPCLIYTLLLPIRWLL